MPHNQFYNDANVVNFIPFPTNFTLCICVTTRSFTNAICRIGHSAWARFPPCSTVPAVVNVEGFGAALIVDLESQRACLCEIYCSEQHHLLRDPIKGTQESRNKRPVSVLGSLLTHSSGRISKPFDDPNFELEHL